MNSIYQDIRYALRMLRRNRGFTMATVLSLALGIGANAAGFALFDAIILQPLPVKDPEGLVLLTRTGGRSPGAWLSYSTFKGLSEFDNVFAGLNAFSTVGNLTLSVDGRDEQLASGGQLVSGDYYDVLGVKPVAGRLITSDDDVAAAGHPVAVLSYGLWTRRFNRDPAVTGKAIQLNGSHFTIAGVTGPDFYGLMLGASPEITVPISLHGEVSRPAATDPGKIAVQLIGRLQPGVTKGLAASVINDSWQRRGQLSPLGPDERIELVDGSRGIAVWRDQFSAQLRILMVVVWLVLLLTCANVASLLLSRTVDRQKEIAVRLAIGAGRLRLIRQLLTEGLVLASLGGALGLLVAHWSSQILLGLATGGKGQHTITISFSPRMFGYTGLISLLALLLFGIAPALLARRFDLASTLKGFTVHHSRLGINRILVTVQIAASFVLLTGTLLLLQSVRNLTMSDTGFSNKNLLLVRIDSRASGYKGDQLVSLFGRIKERIEALPSVQSVSVSAAGLHSGQSMRASISVPGFVGSSDDQNWVNENSVGPDYFETVGVHLLMGREIGPEDLESGPRVAMVNEAMTRRYFPEQNPIGKQFGYGKGAPVEIVGVVNDAKYGSLREVPAPMIYLPYLQAKGNWTELQVRTTGEPSSLTSAVRHELMAVEKNLPVLEIKTLAERVDASVAAERLSFGLLLFFGLMAVLLACAGVYGLASRTVLQRTREIGIRIALGAAPKSIFRLALRETVVIALAGVALGVPAAILSARLVSSMLFGVGHADPVAMAIATLVMVAVSALAALGPATRATRVDPAATLSSG
jgi:putative ABC transport system permease protein